LEDNAGDARLIEEALIESAAPFQLERVTRLAEALERLKAGGVALVLADLTVPDSSGIETFRKLKTTAPDVPMIVLSGLNDEALALQTVEEGAQDYLEKGSVTSPLLVRAMRYAITRAEAEQALAEERNLLRSVIDNQPDSIYVKDLNGRYQLDNMAHRRSLGMAKLEEVVGRTAFDFFPEAIARKFTADDERVISTGKPIVNRQEPSTEDHGTRKWLSTSKVPLRNREGAIVGILGIGRDITERKRAEEKLAHYNDQLRQRNAQMQEDLRMASEVQQAFLPQQLLTFAKGGATAQRRLHFFSRYIPTGTVSGDFFQVLPLSDTQVGVFICDVMGHGVRAALVTAVQRTLIEELMDVAGDPGEFLTAMNRSLISILRRTRTPLFASGFYLVADAERAEFRFANAGHPKPFHLRRKAGTIEPLGGETERPGVALGVFADAVYKTQTGKLDPGDLVLMYTDGLFEVENPAGDFFDQTRLRETIQRGLSLSTAELFEAALEEVRGFSEAHEFTDDVCLVGMEFESAVN
jgi:sigma-B regulation protein RsbU (phosphoserine phosphatase)